MQTATTINELKSLMQSWREDKLRIAFVPTMGNLHEGHLTLVKQAQKLADRTIVSIFVNPLQFGPTEDFATYPRTLAADSEKLAAIQTDLLFTPTAQELIPAGLEHTTFVKVPNLSNDLCGVTRPHFFQGVATIIVKLFNIVQPHIALFGEKDFQQLTVIRQLIADLNIPIEIIGVPIVRETNGLAMSSRNNYLSADERQHAATLYQTLTWIKEQIQKGQHDYSNLLETAREKLTTHGFKPDYIAIRRYPDLQPAEQGKDFIILAAAYMGSTRLIDNLISQ